MKSIFQEFMKKRFKLSLCLVFVSSFLLTSCGTSDPQADICGSYNKWNWYRYNARTADNFEKEASWSGLAEQKFSELGDKSRKYSGLIDKQLEDYLSLWISAGYSDDPNLGVSMAAALFVRCEDLGFKMDTETLR